MRLTFVLALMVVAVALVHADIYMHNPRGTNNRLNEETRNVQNQNRLFDSQNNAAGGYHWGPPMYYYEGSILPIEWTNQHSCGGSNPNCDCNIVIQYMCGEDLRDGIVRTTIPDDAGTYNRQVAGTTAADNYWHQFPLVHEYSMHENYDYYQQCKARDRNHGLFAADKNLNGRDARSTRQNPATTRYGFECPEERDYYPYWHPTPWVDIAILTDDVSRCSMYQDESFNVVGRHLCSLAKFNNEDECVANGGEWQFFGPHNVDAPECKETPFNRDNHLGNTIDGYTNVYNWTLPSHVSNQECVVRIRYNISSTDYDGWETFAESNGAASPVKPDPYVSFGERNLSLAINTAQFGRTFEDRSNQFQIRELPATTSRQATIFNVNVRGKRGNIVQTFPSVEYDFVPQRLLVAPGDYLHFQWTGSDNNPAGRAGEGTDQTDRSNVVMLDSPGGNHPLEFGATDFWDNEAQEDRMAHLEQIGCKSLAQLIADHGNNQGNRDQDVQNCMKLNAANRYIDGGLHRMATRHSGSTYHYMSTRNNNFTNRSQKGTLVVLPTPTLSPFLMALIGIVVAGATVVVVTPLALLAPTLVFVVIASISQRI